MIYFRKKEIELPEIPIDELESMINQKTSKVNDRFDFTSTIGYIIPEERPFSGKKLKSGSVIVSRHRHTLFFFVPRIVTEWKIKSRENIFVLETKNRLSLLSTLGFLLISLGAVIPILTAFMEFRLPNDRELQFELITLLGMFIGLTYYEIRTTDNLFEKIIRKEKIKNIFMA